MIPVQDSILSSLFSAIDFIPKSDSWVYSILSSLYLHSRTPLLIHYIRPLLITKRQLFFSNLYNNIYILYPKQHIYIILYLYPSLYPSLYLYIFSYTPCISMSEINFPTCCRATWVPPAAAGRPPLVPRGAPPGAARGTFLSHQKQEKREKNGDIIWEINRKHGFHWFNHENWHLTRKN
jgi:hypothetical protein